MDEQKKYEVIKALADHPNGNKDRAAPVSYTHLDVYKRQGLDISNFLKGALL